MSDETMQMSSRAHQNLYNEICDKLHIARNVISKSKSVSFTKDPNRLVRTICFYTGVDKKSIDQVLLKMKPKKTFSEWLRCNDNNDKASLIEMIREVEYGHMRSVIIDLYVNKLQIPTKASIIQAIKETVKSDKEYTPVLLKQDLKNLGFVWKRLPKSEKYIVVENTEQFSIRMKYLYQMNEYRKNNRIIIHVERTAPCFYYITPHRVHSTEIIAVASPQLGLIDIYFPPKLQTLEFWLRNKLHTLPANAVFVLEHSNKSVDWENSCKLPTIHSQKTAMIKWLDAYDIPYDPSLHRGELFALIQKHKVNCAPVYRCCEILKAAGHDVILRPPELGYIKYFKRVLRPIFSKSSMTLQMFKTFVVNKMNNVNPGYWLRQDQMMAENEQTIYEEDQKLELLLDRLMENIKNKSLNVSDFEECEDDEFDTEFLGNVVFDAAPPKKAKSKNYPAVVHPAAPTPEPGPSVSSTPGPSKPGPSKPGPSNPGPSKPGPSNPGPSNPGPSNPGPSNPGPSNPGPSQAQPRSSILYELMRE